MVGVAELTRWSQAGKEVPVPLGVNSRPVVAELNDKICVWNGNVKDLEVACLVSSLGLSASSRAICDACGNPTPPPDKAGPHLFGNISGLSARALVHLNLPRAMFQLPPGETLNFAQRKELRTLIVDALDIVAAQEFNSVALTPLHSDLREDASEDMVHFLLRIVRGFVQRTDHKVECVVLACSSEREVAQFHELLPIYFPIEGAPKAVPPPKVTVRNIKLEPLEPNEAATPPPAAPSTGASIVGFMASLLPKAAPAQYEPKSVHAHMDEGEDGMALESDEEGEDVDNEQAEAEHVGHSAAEGAGVGGEGGEEQTRVEDVPVGSEGQLEKKKKKKKDSSKPKFVVKVCPICFNRQCAAFRNMDRTDLLHYVRK